MSDVRKIPQGQDHQVVSQQGRSRGAEGIVRAERPTGAPGRRPPGTALPYGRDRVYGFPPPQRGKFEVDKRVRERNQMRGRKVAE